MSCAAAAPFSSAAADRLDLHLEVPRELDHVDHRLGGVDVARLERARARSARWRRAAHRCRPSCGTGRRRRARVCASGGLTSLRRPTVAVVSGDWPCATIEIVPSRAKKMEVYGGTVIGPPSPSTGWPVPVVSWPVGVDLQVAGARVGFLAVRALHGDPAVAVDRDVEIAAGREQRARRGCPSPRCALVA